MSRSHSREISDIISNNRSHIIETGVDDEYILISQHFSGLGYIVGSYVAEAADAAAVSSGDGEGEGWRWALRVSDSLCNTHCQVQKGGSIVANNMACVAETMSKVEPVAVHYYLCVHIALRNHNILSLLIEVMIRVWMVLMQVWPHNFVVIIPSPYLVHV